MKKVQAVVYFDGIATFYYYDEEIENMISMYLKNQLALQGKVFGSIITVLNSPPLTYQELNPNEE